MNEEIKALIEREAKPIERWLIEKGFNNEVVSRGRQLPYIYASDAIMMYIQEVALSLFKWRKVEEELPEDNVTILIQNRVGQIMSVYKHGNEWCIIGTNDLVSVETIEYWMPIPNRLKPL